MIRQSLPILVELVACVPRLRVTHSRITVLSPISRVVSSPPNHGIKFQRTDLEFQPIVDADVDYVVDLSRGTTIEHNGARINTVEHTMAALVGLEIDNVLIQLDGPE
uniref:UDP-3-O-acyl-N-acetylglucosamine deacetylase n=1 Tax=Roseivirga sp. TaxID=1964215 RepID=UPI00405680F9